MTELRTAGVIGWPIKHSLSPKMHNYWLKAYGIAGDYIPMPVQPDNLGETMRTLKDKGICGVNLTVPHKELVLPFLDEIDETARQIGAVNTVMVTPGGKLIGTNTDAYGFAENLRQAGALKPKGKAVVLGAGGAARAVCKALVDEGYRLVIANRTPDKARAIAKTFGSSEAVGWEQRGAVLADADLLVNTTSLGLEKQPPLEIDLTLLPKEAVVTDIVYAPLKTPLLAEAEKRGNITVDGLGMLMHQGVPGFEAWFGKRPLVDAALREHLLHG